MSKKNKREQLMAPVETTEPEVVAPQEDNRVEFDSWWASRATRIPAHHHKEVIRADFRGRKLSHMETMETYDAALKAYGVELK